MKNQSVSLVVTALICLGCEAPDSGTQQTALSTLTCPAGQVPFNFSKFTSPMTSEGLSSLAPDESLPKVTRPSNTITITRASCNVQFDWKGILGEFCDGRESCVINRKDCDGALRFSYSCSATPSMTQNLICDGTYDCVGQLACPQEPPSSGTVYPEDKVACVPEKCGIRQRRNKDLQCVDAPERPVELSNRIFDRIPGTTADDEYQDNRVTIREFRSPYPAIGLRDVPSVGRVGDFDTDGIWPYSIGTAAAPELFTQLTNDTAGNFRVLFAGSFYRMKGSYRFADVQNVPLEAKKRKGTLTFYIVDDYGLPTLLSTGTLGAHTVTDSVVRCVLHEIDLSKSTPFADPDGKTDTFFVPFDEGVTVPRDCEQGGPIWSENVKVLAKKHNKPPLEFLNSFRQMRSRLLAAYDVAGKVTYVSQKSSESSTACHPNPLDMYYNQKLETHDRVAYYRQRSTPLDFQFTASDATANAPATVEGERVKNGGIHVRGATKTTIGVSALRPKKIEFKFKSASKSRQFFRADVDWFMSGDDRDFWKNQGLTGQIRTKMDLSLVPLNVDRTPRVDEALPLGPSPLLTSTPEGEMQSMRFEVTNDVKEKFLDKTGPYYAVESGTPYLLRSCISLVSVADNVEVPVEKFEGRTQLVARAGSSGTLSIAPGVFGQERLELLANYTCVMGEMPIVVKLDPSIAPLPADEADQFSDSDPQSSGDARVSQTYDQDNDRRCVKAMVNGQKGEHCDSRTISGLGGSTAATILRTEVSNVDQGNKLVVSKEAELMGLQVFDEEEEKPFVFMQNKANFTVMVSPNFDSIADTINQANTGSNFEAEEKRFSVGVAGLGLALSIKIPLRYGPVQGEVIFEISAGVGVGASLTFKQERETHPKCADGTNNCDALYTVSTTALPFREARAACLANKGGRLVDLRNSAESTKLRSKLGANNEYWVGAQVANEYMKGCAELAPFAAVPSARSAFSARCMSDHKTHLRWLSNDEDFASRTGNANFTFDLNDIQPGTPTLTLRPTELELPKERGVSLKANGEMNTPEMNQSLLYVCKSADSNYATKNEAELKVTLAAGAGMKLAFCTPSADMGICIEGSLNFIEATLEPKITYTHIGVGDSTGGSYISRSNIKMGLEFGMTVLNGSVDAKIVFQVGIFDFELKYNIVEFSGFKIPTGDPIEKEFALTGEP